MTVRAVLIALAMAAAAPVAAQERPVPAGTADSAAADSIVIESVPVREPDAPPAPAFRFGDRIMAVVGGHLLLESEWREQSEVLAGEFGLAPGSEGYEAVALQAFDQMIEDLIIVAAAERDTAIAIDSEQVVQAADAEIAEIRSRFPSDDDFQRQLRQSQWGSLAAYRADIQDRKRRELLGQAFLEANRDQLQPVPVTDAEVREFWDANRAGFGPRPELVRFEEIPVPLTASEAARQTALERARQVLAELESGRDFAAVARQYSDDPGSREQGGDLGWFGRGRMVAEFESAAFAAPPGEIVGPVPSAFGVHVLQVTDQRPEELRARHVLIAYEQSAEDRAAARARAEELRAVVAAGADVDSLQAVVIPGDSLGAALVELSRSQLPPVYARALEGLDPGQPALVETPTGFSVVVFRGTAGGGERTFEEVAPALRQQLARDRAQAAFVERLREEVYVDVRVRPEQALTAR